MLVKLKVHADSDQGTVVKKAGDAHEVWVEAPAERGLTDAAARRASALAIRQDIRRLHIVAGATSPNKIVEVLG